MSKNSVGSTIAGIIIAVIGGVIFMVTLVTAGVLFEAFVLTKLWSWYMTPYFNLPLLSMTAAIGLSLVVSLMTNHGNIYKIPGEEFDWGKFLGHIFFRPSVSLLIGYIVLCYG